MIEWAVRDFLSLDLSFCCCDLTIYTQTLLVLLQRNETTDGLIFSAICQTERLLVSILCFLLFLRFSSSKCSGAHVNDSLRLPELKRNTERVLLHCKATPLSLSSFLVAKNFVSSVVSLSTSSLVAVVVALSYYYIPVGVVFLHPSVVERE